MNFETEARKIHGDKVVEEGKLGLRRLSGDITTHILSLDDVERKIFIDNMKNKGF